MRQFLKMSPLLLILVAIIAWNATDALAAGSVTSLSYGSELTGYSATWLDWEQTEYECYGQWYIYEGDWYCYGEEVEFDPWAGVYGTLYGPSSTLYAQDSATDWNFAQVSYVAAASEVGIWRAQGLHYIGWDVYSITCYEGCYDGWTYMGTNFDFWDRSDFVNVPPSAITSISPNGAMRGTAGTLTIYGTFYGASASVFSSGNDLSLDVTSATADAITVNYSVSPTAQTGTHQITVATDLGSPGIEFTVGDQTPVITSITPEEVEPGTITSVTLTGSGFGLNPTLQVTPPIPVIITNASDTQIDALFDLSGVDDGAIDVVVESHGYSGNGFVAGGGSSQNSNSASLRARTYLEIRMSYNGSEFPLFGDAYITAAPAMPLLKALAVRSNGSALYYDDVYWQVHFWYQSSESVNGQMVSSPEKELWLPSVGTIAVEAFKEFNITAALNGAFVGGYVTVNATYHGRQAEFVFAIKGKNPDPAQIKLRPPQTPQMTPWFFWKMLNHESGFKQFNDNQSIPSVFEFPNFGYPDGWGLAKIDRHGEGHPTELAVMWHWINNIDAAGAVLVTKTQQMGNYWNNLLQTWQAYNNDTSHQPILSERKTTGLGANTCTFSSDSHGNTVNGGDHSFNDALWIKRYNGVDNGDYIYWKVSNLLPGESLGINYREANAGGKRYVERVCGTPEP